GVARTEYQLDGGAWTAVREPFTVTGDGEHKVAYRSVDNAGNVEEARTVTVKVDATAPVTRASAANDERSGIKLVTLAATDATSGVAGTEYSLDGRTWQAYTGRAVAVPMTSLNRTVRFRSTDVAGNVEADKTIEL